VSDELLQSTLRFDSAGGPVTRFVRRDDPDFSEFGEVYFSAVESGAIKAWKRHSRARLLVSVPHGKVAFVLRDCVGAGTYVLGSAKPERLAIPPGAWFGFTGRYEETSIVCSFSDLLHDPSEVENLPLSAFSHDWSQR